MTNQVFALRVAQVAVNHPDRALEMLVAAGFAYEVAVRLLELA